MAETVLEQQVRRREGQEYLSSEDIVGKKVKNPEGYDLGEISSLRVGLPTGRVAYAVLKYGGMFGLGAKHFAVPIEAMVYRPGDDVFVANISKYKLDNESGFQEGDWPREGDWSLIESTRPMGPPSQEEARAVTRTEAPPREVVTTERVEIRETAARTGMPIAAEEVEGRTTTTTVRPVTEAPTTGVVTTERAEIREEAVEETRPVTGAHAPTLGSMVRAEKEEVKAEQPTTTRGPSPGHLSAADLQVYLKGMHYPAGREDLISQARKNNAPESVITTLEGFSGRTYRSAAEVSEEFGSEARSGRPTGMKTTVTEVRSETVAEVPPVTRKARPSLAHLSPIDLQSYLKGVDYPAGKGDLIDHARKNNAPEDMIAALEQFSDRTYRSTTEVSEEFGKIK
ncbi:DUF2795 domain-containing protein [Methanoculleus caldifontis]|nr:DUF2795 domain-containing protein [Methanoculleus sp. Wushi-C6]